MKHIQPDPLSFYYFITDTLIVKKRKTTSPHYFRNKKTNNFFTSEDEALKTLHNIKQVYKNPSIITHLHNQIVMLDDRLLTQRKKVMELTRKLHINPLYILIITLVLVIGAIWLI